MDLIFLIFDSGNDFVWVFSSLTTGSNWPYFTCYIVLDFKIYLVIVSGGYLIL